MPEITYTEKGGSSFDIGVPYTWECEEVKEDTAKTGTPFFDIRCREIETGDKWGLAIYFTEKNAPNISRFLRAVGIVGGEGERINVTKEMVTGRRFIAELQEEKWDNGEKSGVTKKFNNFSFEPIPSGQSRQVSSTPSVEDDDLPF